MDAEQVTFDLGDIKYAMKMNCVNSLVIRKYLTFFTPMVVLVILILASHVHAQTITSFSPALGAIGTTVTISGTNFSSIPADNIVYFGATQATVTSSTATQLSVIVPIGATYQLISVLVNGLTAYSNAPFIVTFPGGGQVDNTTFATREDFTAGSTPYSVCIGDLDGDGKPDLAVLNIMGGTVSIFRNTCIASTITANSFDAKVDFSTGSAPASIALGDLDGDGKLDLAIANNGGNTVSIFRNTSTVGVLQASSFATKVDFPTGGYPWGIAISDLDGDGKTDLLVSNGAENSVSVFRNTSTMGVINGTSFAARVDFSAGINPHAVAIHDMDGDGKRDLVTVNIFGNTISLLRNTSTPGTIAAGSFASKVEFATGPSPMGIAIGDLDGDAKPDMAVINFTSISILKNKCTSGSITASSMETTLNFGTDIETTSVAMDDINGDGNLDLAISHPNGPTVFTNTTPSGAPISFGTKVDFTVGNVYGPGSVAIGDLNGDGRPDLAVSVGFGYVSVFENKIRFAQSIYFRTVEARTMTEPLDLVATSSSGLAVDFSTASNKITVSGTRVSSIRPGTVSITAEQSGNNIFSPAPSITQTFCINPAKPTITFSASNPLAPVLTTGGGESYQWFINGTVIAATGPSITAAAGTYTVKIKIDGCQSDSSDPLEVTIDPPEVPITQPNPAVVTGDISKTTPVSVYPIPARDQLFVKGTSIESESWGVINLLGKESQPPIQFSQDGTSIDIRELSSGIYFLKVNDGKKIVHIKFIKE